jgi:hypothetical protein
MLSISHAVTGAFLAAKLQHPLLYIPITLLAHYLEDWILHWDVGTGLSNGTRKKSSAFYLELIDLILAGILVLFLYPINPLTGLQQFFSGNWGGLHPYFGAFFCLLPDFMEAPRNFLKWNPGILRPLNAFHHAIHRSTPDMARGLLPQIVVLAIIFALR